MNKVSCGTSRIVGCSFSVYPMADEFVDIITEALKEIDSSKVWIETDDVTTCVRGRSEHVFDVSKAIFVHAANSGKHVVFNGTFSVGCPCDSDGDTFMSEDDHRLNEEKSKAIEFDVATKFALYPMGYNDYIQVIVDQVERAQEQGTFTKGVHYASRLDGDVHQVFNTLEESFVGATKISDRSHIVMTATISANSPSKKVKE